MYKGIGRWVWTESQMVMVSIARMEFRGIILERNERLSISLLRCLVWSHAHLNPCN
jgi:hypothetical protein